MNHLWSPWRMTYVENHNSNDECIFCIALTQSDGPENLIVAREKQTYIILNRYPYTSGHLMVVPFAHQPNFERLDSETRAEMMEMTTRCMQVLRDIYHPQAFNMGANIGEAAGAGIADHVHIHIVPRWAGDTNFMSTLATTRVLPESLEETYNRVKKAWLK